MAAVTLEAERPERRMRWGEGREMMTEFENAWWQEQQAKADMHREAIRRRERLLDWLSWSLFVTVTLATTAAAWWLWPL